MGRTAHTSSVALVVTSILPHESALWVHGRSESEAYELYRTSRFSHDDWRCCCLRSPMPGWSQVTGRMVLVLRILHEVESVLEPQGQVTSCAARVFVVSSTQLRAESFVL